MDRNRFRIVDLGRDMRSAGPLFVSGMNRNHGGDLRQDKYHEDETIHRIHRSSPATVLNRS